MDTIKTPLSFNIDGTTKHYVVGTNDYYAHLIRQITLIQPGELPLTVNYGVDDPSFAEIKTATIREKIQKYVDNVRVTKVAVQQTDSGNVNLLISFEVV
jgi:hypothetical protein